MMTDKWEEQGIRFTEVVTDGTGRQHIRFPRDWGTKVIDEKWQAAEEARLAYRADHPHARPEEVIAHLREEGHFDGQLADRLLEVAQHHERAAMNTRMDVMDNKAI